MGDDATVKDYLELLDRQRREALDALTDLDERRLWQRPAPGEWCIGEILDHTRKLNASGLPLLRMAWLLLRPWAMLRRRAPYPVEIADPYARPSFPMGVGWIWTPRHRPEAPVPLAQLAAELEAAHARIRAFYSDKDPALLGHCWLYDPLIGRLNLIQSLRVGIYRDALHYRDVRDLARSLGGD
ncbi:MAG: DinB family protein [Caldilineae bacterium]|nr:DinB family protein [Chloroflexota bacterium]MCB9177356.1 DinB family protein [Caldilineae bacterium]